MRPYNCKWPAMILGLALILGVNTGWAQEYVTSDSVPVLETQAQEQSLSSEARNDAVVLSVVQKHRALFNYYYKRAWKYNQQARGSIKIRVTIQTDGQVKEVEVLSDSVKIRSLTRFILRHAKKWEFNTNETSGSVVDLVFPFAPA